MSFWKTPSGIHPTAEFLKDNPYYKAGYDAGFIKGCARGRDNVESHVADAMRKFAEEAFPELTKKYFSTVYSRSISYGRDFEAKTATIFMFKPAVVQIEIYPGREVVVVRDD